MLNGEINDLLNAKLLLEQIIENAGDGICIINMEYEIVKVSEQLAKSIGLTKKQVLGRKCYEVALLPYCNTENCPISKIRKGERYYTYEAKFNIGNNTVPFLVTATPLINSNNEIDGVILSYKNIRDLIKYQEELEIAKNRAEEESFLKTQFLANISHEIRTPMNGILGLIELLSETNLSPEQKEYMDLIKYSTDRLLSILNNILDFSKIKTKKLELKKNEFNIVDLLENIKEYFQLQAEKKGLDFLWKIDGGIPPTIIGDSDLLNQILFNLLSNAIKFTDRGHVSLEVDITDEDDRSIEISFSVIDTGIGIPENKIEDIFKEFYQLDLSSTKKYEGSGLGLNITKELIEAMEGEIEVESKLGLGSKFTVKLKFNKGNSVDDRQKSKEEIHKLKGFSNLNILVVEDDLINQKIIYNMLARNNWNITLESKGEKALDLIKKNAYDLVILDIYMPGMDGYEIAKKIREIDSKYGVYTPIIAITATTTMECRRKCEDIGFDGFIIKPIRGDEAYKKIISILNQKAKLDLHLEDLLSRIDNNKKLLKELIEEMISDSYEKEFLGNISTYIANRDFINLRKIIHKFKGSISYFGAGQIIKLLEEIESNIENGNMDLIRELYEDVKCEFTKLKGKYINIIESKDL